MGQITEMCKLLSTVAVSILPTTLGQSWCQSGSLLGTSGFMARTPCAEAQHCSINVATPATSSAVSICVVRCESNSVSQLLSLMQRSYLMCSFASTVCAFQSVFQVRQPVSCCVVERHSSGSRCHLPFSSCCQLFQFFESVKSRFAKKVYVKWQWLQPSPLRWGWHDWSLGWAKVSGWQSTVSCATHSKIN